MMQSHLVLRHQKAVTARVSLTVRKFRIQNSSAGHWIFLILLDGSQKYRTPNRIRVLKNRADKENIIDDDQVAVMDSRVGNVGDDHYDQTLCWSQASWQGVIPLDGQEPVVRHVKWTKGGQLPFQTDQLLRMKLVTNMNNNPIKHHPSLQRLKWDRK